MKQTLQMLKSIGFSKPVEEMVLITDEPKIPGYLCFSTEETRKRFQAQEVFGQGYDPNRIKARIKALGEFLERLCLYNPEGEFTISTYQPNGEFINPGQFYCYSEEQDPNREQTQERIRKQKFRWWPVKDLTGKEFLIPAQLVFLADKLDDEYPIRKERISTGAALGPIGTQYAFHGGLMEALERDACISSYLKRRALKKITNLPKDLEELVEYLRRYQLEPHLLDATTDLGVPTVLVVTLDYSGIGAAVNVGSRSDSTYYDAIKYAMLESIHCRRTSRILKPIQCPDKLPTEQEITSIDHRFYYWHSLERIRDLGFWLNQEDTIAYSDLIDTSRGKVLQTLQSKGYQGYIADITLRQIREHGFEALKIIIPELHPLYLDERAKALHSKHYGDIPEDITLKPHPLT